MSAATKMNRRRALCCAGALSAGLFSSLLTGCERSEAGEARVINPCRATPVPHGGDVDDLIARALDGIDTARLVDTHAHLLGVGDGGSGCRIHPSMGQWWHPMEMMRRKVILHAACVPDDSGSIDARYVQRLRTLTEGFPQGARWWLFAFAKAHDDDGRARDDWSTFHVPDAYAARVAAAHADRFDWVASVHPYAPDALEQLAWAEAHGAVAVKWLPSAMNIDPSSPRCRAFYEALRACALPLIVHGGEEKAVPGASRAAFGNPLMVRPALAEGVQVIVAHAASLGHAEDLDRRSHPNVPAFDLFARLMNEHAGSGLLKADLSAVFQRNREPAVWRALLGNESWHAHLVHGSDHPLPGVMPLIAPARLVKAGVLDASLVNPLQRLREHNALLFDLVLKRLLRLGSTRLPASIFEARALARRPLAS